MDRKETNLNLEIENLNLDNIDVEELERRLELQTIAVPDDAEAERLQTWSCTGNKFESPS